MQYHQIQKVGSGFSVDIFYNSSTKRYIKATYSQLFIDYNQDTENVFKYGEFYDAEQCGKEHFLNVDNYKHSDVKEGDLPRKRKELENQQAYWDGYSLLCIPIDAANQIVLEGSEIATKSRALIFEIRPCSNDTLN